MDRLEFLVEERSMAEVLKVLLPRILPASWVLDENYFIRPHEGKSDLKRSIPKKLKDSPNIKNRPPVLLSSRIKTVMTADN